MVAINDPFISADYMAYMFKYDTLYGKFGGDVSVMGSCLVVDGEREKHGYVDNLYVSCRTKDRN